MQNETKKTRTIKDLIKREEDQILLGEIWRKPKGVRERVLMRTGDFKTGPRIDERIRII